MKQLLVLAVLLLHVGFATAQISREMRGIWVATVNNIDYPSKQGLSSEQQKEEWRNLLFRFKKMGLNTVVAQVRPASDAFYPSDLAPWSRFITGIEGLPPQPFYDPLRFMVETTHEAGMEFHAWLNPYRATTNSDTTKLATNHVLRTHPEWMKWYAGKAYLNPALPEVRGHIADVVAEIVTKYAVDAIHFDDYFYPYRVSGEVYDDSAEFAKYGAPEGFSSVNDWRRENVNRLIKMVHERMKFLAPDVQFGISPFGVWRNQSADPLGSDTRAGVQCYDDLYADIVLWLKNGWIDYVAPQNYWNIGFNAADYSKVTEWWSNNAYGKNLYMGLAMYKVANNAESAWSKPNEIPNQVRLNRQTPFVEGSMLFNTSSTLKNNLGVKDSMRYLNTTVAIWPQHRRPDYLSASDVEWRRISNHNKKPELLWRIKDQVEKADSPWYFAIYRANGRNANVVNDSNLIAITAFDILELRWIDTSAVHGKIYTYAVVPFSKHHITGTATAPRSFKVGTIFSTGTDVAEATEPTTEPTTPTGPVVTPNPDPTTPTKPTTPVKKCGFFKRLFGLCKPVKAYDPGRLPFPHYF